MQRILERKPMIKLGHCPSCRGWTYLEPGPGEEVWQVCVNCGWQRPLAPPDALKRHPLRDAKRDN